MQSHNTPSSNPPHASVQDGATHKPSPATNAAAWVAARRVSGAGAWLQVLASLLWIPQAALLAAAVQAMADGRGMQALWPLAGGVLALGILRAWCDGQGVLQANRSARRVLSQLRAQVVQALAQASPLDIGRASSGQAASAMAEQAESLVPWLSRYQSAMRRVRVVPLLIVVAVAFQSWVAALILICAAPLIPMFMAIVGWRAKAASEEQLVQLGDMNSFLLDRLRGLSTLRGLGAVQATTEQLGAHAQSLRVRTMRVLRIAFLSSAVLELFSALGVAMVAVYIGFHLLGVLQFGAWGDKLTLGQALFVLLLAPTFFDPLRELSAVWHDRASGEAALERLQQMADQAQPVLGSIAMPETLSNQELLERASSAQVQVFDLGVQVPGAVSRLAPLSFSVQPGEHVALCSPSGSGKSVLLAQLAGLVAVQSGQIVINGQELNADSASCARQGMAWMGQQPHVFAASVEHNVTLGNTNTSRQVQQAVELAELGQTLQHRPAASLGEGGAGLSGGEALRLALARLSLQSRHAGLLLVDEPTAHLDPATADRVVDALLQIAEGRTLIVATHDARLAQRMDRVIELPLLQPEPAEGLV